jgi:hypothetical protein
MIHCTTSDKSTLGEKPRLFLGIKGNMKFSIWFSIHNLSTYWFALKCRLLEDSKYFLNLLENLFRRCAFYDGYQRAFSAPGCFIGYDCVKFAIGKRGLINA